MLTQWRCLAITAETPRLASRHPESCPLAAALSSIAHVIPQCIHCECQQRATESVRANRAPGPKSVDLNCSNAQWRVTPFELRPRSPARVFISAVKYWYGSIRGTAGHQGHGAKPVQKRTSTFEGQVVDASLLAQPPFLLSYHKVPHGSGGRPSRLPRPGELGPQKPTFTRFDTFPDSNALSPSSSCGDRFLFESPPEWGVGPGSAGAKKRSKKS